MVVGGGDDRDAQRPSHRHGLRGRGPGTRRRYDCERASGVEVVSALLEDSRRGRRKQQPLMPSWYLLLALAFIVANGYFVATEFAIIKVRPTQLAELAAEGSSRAKMARRVTKRLDSYLSATQLGVTLASLALGWVGEPAVAQLIQPFFSR